MVPLSTSHMIFQDTMTLSKHQVVWILLLIQLRSCINAWNNKPYHFPRPGTQEARGEQILFCSTSLPLQNLPLFY